MKAIGEFGPIDLIKLQKLLNRIRENPDDFIVGSGVKVFLSCFSLHKFYNIFR